MKQFHDFKLDLSNECLWRGSTQIALAPKPFGVLRYLVEHPGRLITHDELLEALWPETYVQPQVLRTYMLELRKVLGDDAGQARFIQTHPKRGYCFVAPVTDEAAATSGPATPCSHAKAVEIVGREEEMLRLTAQLQAVSAGERRVVFVTGEAGIGKTTLVEAFCKQMDPALAARAIRGQCVDGFSTKEDYYPVIEALGQLCASTDGERACQVLARMAPAWLAGVKRGPADFPFAPQALLPGDLCLALEELSTEKPLVLIFEDLHWADDATLHLISALARRRAMAKLMVIATCRSLAVAGEHPLNGLKQDLLMRRLGAELALGRLASAAVGELLSKELKQAALPPGLAGFVYQHSEGNPLFAIAILEHLIAQRFLACEQVDGASRWRQSAPFQEMEAGVPDGLAQMIALEIDRLTPQEQRILEAGSLLSVAFPAWAVAAALQEDVAETEEACDALARRLYFVERAGQDELLDGTSTAFYVFTHGMYREALYQRQTVTRRARRHIRIAEKLGAIFNGREASVAREMAFHYEAAGAWQGAVDALRAAAAHALQRQAFAEAADLLEHAVRVAENLSGDHTGAELRAIDEELQAARQASHRVKTLCP